MFWRPIGAHWARTRLRLQFVKVVIEVPRARISAGKIWGSVSLMFGVGVGVGVGNRGSTYLWWVDPGNDADVGEEEREDEVHGYHGSEGVAVC